MMRSWKFVAAIAGLSLALTWQTGRAIEGDPAGQWEKFIATAKFAEVFDAYGVLDDLGYGEETINADSCRTQSARLDDAIARVPVSIALHHAAMLCADATGDDARAERELAAVGTLARDALSSTTDSLDPHPIRIVHPVDAIAMMRLAKLEVSYAYYRQFLPGRGMPYTLAAWDPQRAVERHFTFDYVDTAARINRGDQYSGFPVDRFVIGRTFRDEFASKGDIAAIDAKSLHDAVVMPVTSDRVAVLRKSATLGGTLSVTAWIAACTVKPYDGCSQGLVDALLPQAEARRAVPMLQLAYLYESGLGIARDEKAAEALVRAADVRWPDHAASVGFADLWSELRPAEDFPPWLRQRLLEGQAAGSTDARVELIRRKFRADPDVVLDAGDIAALAAPASNGSGTGARQLALYFSRRKEDDAALQWMRKAAAHGNADAQAGLAYKLLYGDATIHDEVEGNRWREAAAQGGNGWAQRLMAYAAESESKWADARKWLLGSILSFDVASTLELAEMMEWERPGAEGTVADAIETYRQVAAANLEGHSADARRRLAAMAIAGRGMEKDAAQAEAWLLQDAVAGDMESAAMLGLGYLRGTVGASDEGKGREWVEKALAAGQEVHGEFGWWLFYRKADAASRQEALQVWRRGIEKKDAGASNNLAWVLCTSPDPAIVDPKAGVAIADAMAQEELDPGSMDTVAACHAAVGDFPRAIAIQQEALDKVVARKAEQDAANFRERLALYRAGKPYLETEAP
jgi:TPR repeat protein